LTFITVAQSKTLPILNTQFQLSTHTNSRHLTNKRCLTKGRFRGHSITNFRYIIKVKWQVNTTWHVAHLFSWSIIIFTITPKHTDASLPYWHRFKNSIMTEIMPLNPQPFTNSHFYFPIILETVTFQVLFLQSELHYRFLCLSSEIIYMPHHMSTAYFHYDRILNFVTRWGKHISIDGEYDEEWR
jgi:hypothetical protein